MVTQDTETAEANLQPVNELDSLNEAHQYTTSNGVLTMKGQNIWKSMKTISLHPKNIDAHDGSPTC